MDGNSSCIGPWGEGLRNDENVVNCAEVLQTLVLASSQDANVLKPAEEKLKRWETNPGFYSALMSVVLNYDLDVNVRLQAVIYVKNGVDRNWRRQHTNVIKGCISEEERADLRVKMMCSLNEPINQIATQLAVLVSKIARLDYPQFWPELLPSLLDAVKKEEEVVQHRALLVFNHVTKSLASKRLAGDRRHFQELTANIFNFVLNLWNTHTQQFCVQVVEGNYLSLQTLDKALLSLKVLRKLVVHGFKEPHKVDDVVLFLTVIFERMKTTLELRRQFVSNLQLKETLEKYIILLTKVLMDVLDHHPFSFIQFIQPTLQFTFIYVIQSKEEDFLFERFIVQSMHLVKSIVLCLEYKPAKTVEETKDPNILEAYRIKTGFFTPPILIEMCHKLLSHYFLLTHDDLTLWEEDPESFALEEKGDSWRYSLRVSTELLFLAVYHEYREVLTPVLLDLLTKNESSTDFTSMNSLLLRDAIYNAVGLAAFDLYDEVDFDNWLVSSLLKELRRNESSYKIIRRRVVWLIGQWVSVKLSPDLRPILYDNILPLLRPEEDLVVRLTAAEALKVSVDDFEFNTEQFSPYLEPSFSLLFHLLKQVQECDTKMHVLHVLSFLVERVGSAIRPHAPALAQYLPLLWDESADHNMLRCAILTTLFHLVEGLGILSEQLYPVLIPIIRLSTDVTQEPHVYLMEDGLELWRVTLENASVLTAEMFHLFPNLLPILELGTECLRTCFHIIQAYILICPLEFKSNYLPSIVDASVCLLRDMRNDGIVMIMRFLEVTLKVLPNDGPRLCKPLLLDVCRIIFSAQDSPMVLSMCLSVFARAVIHDTECVMYLMGMLALERMAQMESVFGPLMDIWISKMGLVTHVERRKVLGLALVTLLSSRNSVITDRFCGILLSVVEVLHDIMRTDDAGIQVDCLMITDSDITYEDNEKEHSKRKKQLSLKDPIHTVELRQYVMMELSRMQETIGQVAFEDLMQTVDVETKQQLQEHLNYPLRTN